MKKWYIFIMLGMLSCSAIAQELLCRVSVVTTNMQGVGASSVDKSIFNTMEQELTAFMNDRKWSDYTFKPGEKIECGLQFVIDEATGNDVYSGKIYVQLSRPVFNSSYASSLLSYQDNNLQFKYTTNQTFDYDENSYMWTITSIAAYYANLFLGITFDSYAPNGGTPFYNKCQNVISSAPSGESGWSSSSKERRNRYWLLESLSNPSYETLRKFLYQYHRLGLDVMHKSVDEGVEQILANLELLKALNSTYSNNAGIAIFCMTKANEFVNVFSGASPENKAKAVAILRVIDPSNIDKYDKLSK